MLVLTFYHKLTQSLHDNIEYIQQVYVIL